MKGGPLGPETDSTLPILPPEIYGIATQQGHGVGASGRPQLHFKEATGSGLRGVQSFISRRPQGRGLGVSKA